MKHILFIYFIVFCFSIVAQNESGFYTSPSIVGVEKNFVTDYGAIPNDGTDHSTLLQQAIDELGLLDNGGVLFVPAGTYCFYEIDMASNVHLMMDEDVVIVPSCMTKTGNYSIFYFGDDTDYIKNVKISAKTGRFTVDLRNLTNRNVRVASLLSVDNFSVSDIVVLDDITRFAAITGGISFYNDEWLIPRNGVVKNIELHDAHYGYGVVQMQAGDNIFFKNLWGDGGVTLRFETGYNKMNLLQVGGVDNMYGKNIFCQNGNAALMISPHATDNGHVEVDSVEAVNCGFAVRIEKGYATHEQDSAGLDGGYYANTSKVSNVKATYGSSAQVKSKHFKYMPCSERELISETYNPDGESYSAPSIAAMINGAAGTGDGRFMVTTNDVDGFGFQHQPKAIIFDEDADDCTSTIVDDNRKNDVELYPNPFTDVINITLNDWSQYQTACIYDLTGQLMLQKEITQSSLLFGQDLPKGLYIVRFVGQGNSLAFPMCKH